MHTKLYWAPSVTNKWVCFNDAFMIIGNENEAENKK